MLGSGSYRINRNFKWLRVDHLKVIDGIRSKAFLGSNMQMIEESKREDSNYLTFCFGEPVLVQIVYSRNEIVVTVSNKDIWHEIQELIAGMLEELTDGTAEVVDYKMQWRMEGDSAKGGMRKVSEGGYQGKING